MHAFSVPAPYQPFVLAELRRIADVVNNDRDLRLDDDARIRALASVPEYDINPALPGTCTILVNVSGDPDARKRVRDVLATGAVNVL